MYVDLIQKKTALCHVAYRGMAMLVNTGYKSYRGLGI